MCEANTLQDANNNDTFGVCKYERQVLSYHGRVIYYFQITISKLLVEEKFVFGLGRARTDQTVQ